MSRLDLIGDACAMIPGKDGGKSTYRKIGTAFTDNQARVVLKIDTLPLFGSGWEGWVNIFERKPQAPSSPHPRQRRSSISDMDDDIPF